ncbi:uncharacterized protein [Hoplias malabaricus]|uniref:uncharacterized protein n=1 Tax=Hoplias malabaricus TaxID=27720 RepID=UPI0034632D1E
MRAELIFLLLYSGVFGVCSVQHNVSTSGGYLLNSTAPSDTVADFLVCVGVPEGPESGEQHVLNLKSLIDTTLDLYSFTRSSVNGFPVLDISGNLNVNWFSLMENDDFLRFWTEVKLIPSVSQNFLSCLSHSNFSCASYQTMVEELSQHYFSLDAEKQQWIYSFFMYPFLSRNSSAGCVNPGDSNEDWLMKNFGSFSVLARIRDFKSINLLFNGLEVLHLLSAEQKAEILLYPDLLQLDNSSLGLVLDSLLNSSFSPAPNGSVWNPPDYSPQDPFSQVMNEFMTVYNPTGSFVREFVSLTQQPGLSSAMFVQAMMNWTLAELATQFKQNSTVQTDTFDPMDVNAWFSHVVAPVLRRFLTSEIPPYITEVFHSLYYIEIGTSGYSPNLCQITLEEPECAVNNLMEHLSKILYCAANANLTLNSETLDSLALHLTSSFNSLLRQLALTNFSSPDSPFFHLLDRIHDLSPSNLQNPEFISMWFQIKLKPQLSSITPQYLSCLGMKPFSCQTFQILVGDISQNMALIPEGLREVVFNDFIYEFLFHQLDTGCVDGLQTADWLTRNLGHFYIFASLSDLMRLNPSFNPLDVLSILTEAQLVELVNSTYINSSASVNMLLMNIQDSQFFSFFSALATTLSSSQTQLSPEVQQALLQQVFDRVNFLSISLVPDDEMQVWLSVNLPPLISAILPEQVPVLFTAVLNRTCSISHAVVALFNSSYSNLSLDIQQNISSEIIISLQVPEPLRCYGNGSFYSFLQSSFMNFSIPPLSVFLTLIPSTRLSEVLNTITPAELYIFLSKNKTVDVVEDLCELFNNYQRTPEYLQKEPVVSTDVGRQTLICVWPQALRASSQTEVDQWFNASLSQYLPFLSSQLISPTELSSATCLAFRKFVSVLGSYNYSGVEFTKYDVYLTIQSYLSTDSTPVCFVVGDPVLNSTSWFADYIGSFISFITYDDLIMFGDYTLVNFTTNMENLQLFQMFSVSPNVSDFYTQLLYLFDASFSAALLPPALLCYAPESAFFNLSLAQTLNISQTLHYNCNDTDPTVSAALAQNMGPVMNSTFQELGNSSVGLSTGQISSADPSIIYSSLGVLSTVMGWSQAQAMTIVQALINSGKIKFNTPESFLMLGTVASGVPSSIFSAADPKLLKETVQSQSFVNTIVTAPSVIQQSIVNQIIKFNSSSDGIVNNIPNSMAPQIPRNALLTLSPASATLLNQKQWQYQQVILFFDTVANAVNVDSISIQVLQGFTCTRVKSFDSDKVMSLIHACQPRGSTRVPLQESQLTCMNTYVNVAKVNNFALYPAELLLYFDYSQVEPSLCRAYFSALGGADLSVLSNTLSFRKQVLLSGALQCLGVSGLNVSRPQLEVLGSLVCLLNSSYILNSDVYVLEKLELCQGLSNDQSSAVETALLTKNTTYGSPSNWNDTTLTNLGFLPVFLSSSFWSQFSKNDKILFLRRFIPRLRRFGFSRSVIYNIMRQAGQSSKNPNKVRTRSRRETGCTVGLITQVQANDDSFPFGYDAIQFNACLSAQVLRDNLAAIADKAMGSDYQNVILDKYTQAYPNSINDIVLQALGPAACAATVAQISSWNITKVDTLAALFKPSNGNWNSDQINALISRYLSVSGNSLGSVELNAIKGPNLCELNLNIISNINYTSLQNANALNVTTCSPEHQRALFLIAQQAFGSNNVNRRKRETTTVSASSFQLITNYLNGADLAYVQTLAMSNISMDLPTFISLNTSVVNALTVPQVVGLLGNNLPALVTYVNSSVVQGWISRQPQSELDQLKLGLTGGITTNSATTANTAGSANMASISTASVGGGGGGASVGTASTAKPSGSSSSVQPFSRLQKLLLLAVVMATMNPIHG